MFPLSISAVYKCISKYLITSPPLKHCLNISSYNTLSKTTDVEQSILLQVLVKDTLQTEAKQH